MARRTTLEEALESDEEAATSSGTHKPAVRTAKAKEPARPIKLTIELDQELHMRLKSFALLKAGDASLANIVRAAINVMDENQRFAKAVIDEATRLKTRKS